MSTSAAHWRRNQAAVTIATFIGFTGFTLVMPFLPLYLEQLGEHDRSVIAIWSGLSLGVTPAITAAMAPFWARLADRYGRKIMVARSLGAFIVVMAVMAAVQHPWQVFALRAILGLFAGYGGIAMTMAAESVPAEYMAAAIGWVQTAQRVGPALGPVIGGALAEAFGLRRAFLVAAVVYLGAFLLVVFGYREQDARSGDTRALPVAPPSFSVFRRMPHFVLFMGVIFGLQLVDRSFGPILPLYLGEVGAEGLRTSFVSGVIFTIAAGAAAAGNQLTSTLLRWQPVAVLVPISCAVAGVAACVFAAAPGIFWLVTASIPFGLGMGVATTAIYTQASHSMTPSMRGVAFGYLTTAYLVGLAVSPVLAGFIGALSMRTVFIVDAAGLVAVAAVVRQQMATGRAEPSS